LEERLYSTDEDIEQHQKNQQVSIVVLFDRQQNHYQELQDEEDEPSVSVFVLLRTDDRNRRQRHFLHKIGVLLLNAVPVRRQSEESVFDFVVNQNLEDVNTDEEQQNDHEIEAEARI
jgi:hypothetical protein